MDIDIDLAPGVDVESLFRRAVRASRVEENVIQEHPVGIYFQDIPVDSVTGYAAIPYNHAEDFGYYKIDMLTVNVLKQFNSKDEMLQLQEQEPDWSLLEDEKVVKKLFHLGKHFDVVKQVKPRSVQVLADVLALIRPHKRPLLNKYLQDPDKFRTELFTKRTHVDIRKAHAIPYALIIVLQLHLVKQGRL